MQLQDSGLEWISGVFIDNSENLQQFQLRILETGQRYTIPAQSQASLSLLGIRGADKVSLYGTTIGNVDVPITLQNFEGTGLIWSVVDPGQIVGAITVNGAVTALPSVGTFVDGSGTIAAGNTSQLLFAANPARKGLYIYNLTSSNEILGVSLGGALALDTPGIYEIYPGGSLNFDGLSVPGQAIFVNAATTGHKFTASQI